MKIRDLTLIDFLCWWLAPLVFMLLDAFILMSRGDNLDTTVRCCVLLGIGGSVLLLYQWVEVGCFARLSF
jgi:hypothetical protein